MRYVWAAPATALGLAIVAAGARQARVRIVDGVIEAHGPTLDWALTHLTLLTGGVTAITLGHVVIGRTAAALDDTRAHERIHVRQYEVWGPAFLPAYALASVWALVRGGDFYLDNWFERQACSHASRPPDRQM